MGYWDTPPMDRTQFVLFSPTLDAVIPEDHSVRLFDEILVDSNHATGQNLAELEEREVTSYMPVEGGSPADNPALREDPSEPVPATEWDRLPRTSKGKLDKAAFVYDALSDCYHCPLGRKLEYKGTMRQGRKNGEVHYRRYECASCEGCPLAGAGERQDGMVVGVYRIQSREAGA